MPICISIVAPAMFWVALSTRFLVIFSRTRPSDHLAVNFLSPIVIYMKAGFSVDFIFAYNDRAASVKGRDARNQTPVAFKFPRIPNGSSGSYLRVFYFLTLLFKSEFSCYGAIYQHGCDVFKRAWII